MPNATRTLGADLAPIVTLENPGYGFSLLRVDLENRGTAAVTGWAILARAVPGAPLRDITPASLTSADGYLVVTPSPRAANNLPAGQNTQLALNVTLWSYVEIQFRGPGAELAARWEGLA